MLWNQIIPEDTTQNVNSPWNCKNAAALTEITGICVNKNVVMVHSEPLLRNLLWSSEIIYSV